jgi:hypothetical protein
LRKPRDPIDVIDLNMLIGFVVPCFPVLWGFPERVIVEESGLLLLIRLSNLIKPMMLCVGGLSEGGIRGSTAIS